MDDRLTTYTTCTGAACRALLLWVVTIGGARMPLDKEPHADGNVRITRMPDGSIRGVVLTGNELPAPDGVLVYRPHHRTCPDSAEFRRRRASTGPQCRAGDGPLSPWLSDRGRKWHVNCEPVTAADAGVVLTPMPTPPPERKPSAPDPLPGLDGAA